MKLDDAIATRTIGDQIVAALRDAILAQALPIGSRMIDSEIAEHYGVSRSTMRDALRTLVHEGLVTSIANRGYFVADLDTAYALELLELRGLLEGRAASEAIDNLEDGDLERLDTISDEIGVCDYKRDIQHIRELDLEFHDIITRRAERPLLHELWSSLNSRLHLLDVLCADLLQVSADDSAERHRAYIRALRSGNSHVAESAAVAHYLQHRDRVLEQSRIHGGDRSIAVADWSGQ